MNFVYVGLAGLLGAVARYLVYLSEPLLNQKFPYATLFINLSGCLLAGILYAISVRLNEEFRHIVALIIVGFVGSYTTFSTFGMESLQLIEANAYGQAILNVSLNVIGGMVMICVGRMLVNFW